MVQWLEQRGQSISLTQPVSAASSSSIRARGCELENLTSNTEFTFLRLLWRLCGYTDVGCRSTWWWSRKKVNIELSPVSHIYITKLNQILSNVNWNSNIFQKNMKNSIKIQLFRFALKLSEINWNINFHH